MQQDIEKLEKLIQNLDYDKNPGDDIEVLENAKENEKQQMDEQEILL